MNITKTKFKISFELLILLISNLFIPAEAFLLIAFCYLIFLITIRNNGKIIVNTRSHILYLIIILCFGTSIGLLHLKEYSLHWMLRDIFYILNPIIFVLLGVYLCKTWGKKYDLYKTIVVAAVIVSCVNLSSLITKIGVIRETESISIIRDKVGFTGLLVVIGLVLLITQHNRNVLYFSKIKNIMSLMICLTSFTMSFSRTNFVAFITMILIIYIYDFYITRRDIKQIFIIALCIPIVYFVFYMFVPKLVFKEFLY